MRIQVGKDENEWVKLVWHWVHTETRPHSRVFIPAGNTPAPIYRHWSEVPSDHLQSLKFIQIDDILSGPARGTFRTFFEQAMTPYLGQFEWIGEAGQTADVAILGVGLNGHVAFHEPGLPRDFYSGCVSLATTTLQALRLPAPTWGLTYGVASFLKCRKILILARGEQKKRILQATLTDKSLPITWVMEHADVTLISDFSL